MVDLKKAFPAVFSNQVGLTTVHEHKIVLKPDSIPVRAPLRPVPYSKEEALKEELDNCLRLGVVETVEDSKCLWNSPVHVVVKPDGSPRVTVDYSQTINPCIVPTNYHLPRPQDIMKNARNAKFLSKIDLKLAYWHIPLTKESKPLTSLPSCQWE